MFLQDLCHYSSTLVNLRAHSSKHLNDNEVEHDEHTLKKSAREYINILSTPTHILNIESREDKERISIIMTIMADFLLKCECKYNKYQQYLYIPFKFDCLAG